MKLYSISRNYLEHRVSASARCPGCFPSELPLPTFGGTELGKAGDAGFLGCPRFPLQALFLLANLNLDLCWRNPGERSATAVQWKEKLELHYSTKKQRHNIPIGCMYLEEKKMLYEDFIKLFMLLFHYVHVHLSVAVVSKRN